MNDRPVRQQLRLSGLRIRRTVLASIPNRHLAQFKGTLQADAYAGFNRLYDSGDIKEAACWAHVRRKFFDIQQAHSSPLAAEALERIAELYVIEREIRGRSPDERKQVRQARSTPLIASLARMDAEHTCEGVAQV